MCVCVCERERERERERKEGEPETSDMERIMRHECTMMHDEVANNRDGGRSGGDRPISGDDDYDW